MYSAMPGGRDRMSVKLTALFNIPVDVGTRQG